MGYSANRALLLSRYPVYTFFNLFGARTSFLCSPAKLQVSPFYSFAPAAPTANNEVDGSLRDTCC